MKSGRFCRQKSNGVTFYRRIIAGILQLKLAVPFPSKVLFVAGYRRRLITFHVFLNAFRYVSYKAQYARGIERFSLSFPEKHGLLKVCGEAVSEEGR